MRAINLTQSLKSSIVRLFLKIWNLLTTQTIFFQLVFKGMLLLLEKEMFQKKSKNRDLTIEQKVQKTELFH